MHCFTPPYSFCPRTHKCPTNPLFYAKNTILPHEIREMKMICFILRIRMSNCSLHSVTWELRKLIQMAYTSRVISELFIEVLSYNKLLSNATISWLDTVNIVYLKSLYHNRPSHRNLNSRAFTVVNKLLKVVRLDLSSVSSSYLSVNSKRYPGCPRGI